MQRIAIPVILALASACGVSVADVKHAGCAVVTPICHLCGETAGDEAGDDDVSEVEAVDGER